MARRLSTVRSAHRILVLDKGRVVEQGSHHELMAAGGRYAGLQAGQFMPAEGFGGAIDRVAEPVRQGAPLSGALHAKGVGMDLEIRHIAEEEQDKLVRLRMYGFGNYPPRYLNELDLRRMLPDELLGAYVDGRMVATVHTYRLRQVVRGVLRPLGGIAGVAAYPEVRRRGVIRRLMQRSLEEMHEEGLAVSMLRPFRVSFYAQYGYTTTDDTVQVTYPTRAFEPYLQRDDAKELRIDRATPEDGWDEYVHLDGEVSGAFHGALSYDSIRPEMRDRRLRDFELVFFRKGGRTLAGAIFRKEGAEPDGVLHLESYRFVNATGLAALLRFAALHIDQCRQVDMNVAPAGLDGRLFVHTGDVDEDVQIRPMRRPWMVRIVDVVKALHGVHAAVAGELRLHVTDHACPWNNGIYRLASAGERLTVERAAAAEVGATAHADLSLSISELTAFLYGSQPPESARGEGDSGPSSDSGSPDGSGRSAEARALLQNWFPRRFLWNDWWF